ncbi:hypothetical protein D1115_02840 [Vibrio alfacsensis]|uniref:Uncharacterized protein n=1 Tax=Vibrio alfacsensis TaxID=1074311 RepID=A0ABM6YRZ7_9VIBR|nr:hypothetical protein D1115_02840 [Vibrio alfacsensis]
MSNTFFEKKRKNRLSVEVLIKVIIKQTLSLYCDEKESLLLKITLIPKYLRTTQFNEILLKLSRNRFQFLGA